MILTTRGIVFHHINYGDTSVIAKVYTEDFGLRSYMVRGAKSKKAGQKMGMLQPLSLVALTARHKEGNKMVTLRELRLIQGLNTSYTPDVLKNCIGLFLAEVLYRSVKEESPNPALFLYLFNTIQMLEVTQDLRNFHLCFLMQLTRHLGFYPRKDENTEGRYFDLKEGRFTDTKPHHPHVLASADASVFSCILGTKFDKIYDLRLNNQTRRRMLNCLLDYYQWHLEGMGEIKSHKVLETVLKD